MLRTFPVTAPDMRVRIRRFGGFEPVEAGSADPPPAVRHLRHWRTLFQSPDRGRYTASRPNTGTAMIQHVANAIPSLALRRRLRRAHT